MDSLAQDAQRLFRLSLSTRQVAAFARYAAELVEWNAKFNLTAIRDTEGMRVKHFLDSLSCALVFGEKPPASLIDIGTGAGFPGIPLKILYPALRLTLVESVGKKAGFCRHIVETLGLDKVTVLQERAEDVGRLPAQREIYDVAVARAVASLPILVELLLPLVRVGGVMIAQKGESGLAEAHASQRALNLLGGRLRQLIQVTLPGVADERYLVVIDKIAATPPAYPRRVGIPAKNPL